MKRRDFINNAALSGSIVFTGVGSLASVKTNQGKIPTLDHPQSMTKEVLPITLEERESGIKKAQRLLKENAMKALVLDAGTSLEYFTGIRWWPSERTMVAVIPAEGAVSYACPAFEEGRMQDLITIGKKVYTWEEDKSPYKMVAQSFKDAGIRSGTIGMEESLRFFILDGIKKAAPGFTYVSGDPVTMPCLMVKSAAEIALMQKATDVTTAAIKIGISSLDEGMRPFEFASVVVAAHEKLGAVNDFAMANFGKASAFPHGSLKPQYLKKGDIVLMDCGCKVEGYSSDMSRTIVFGMEPTKRQLEIWNLEKKSQASGFAAAKIGAACENVDAASRKVLTDAGFGPGYKLPGLPHRTGHSIGMDGHEWGYMVKGNQQPIQAGMCFSVEPIISIIGEFGIRLEDCVYMTEEGPRWFSEPSVSIDHPFA